MNRKLKQWVCGLLIAFLMTAMMPFQVIESYAAAARISFSDPTTKVGETFTVKMKFECTSGEMLGDTKVMLDYDANVLEFINEADNASGGAGKISVRSGLEGKTVVETQLKFKALQAGKTSITINDWDGYDNNGEALSMEREGSSTITIESLPTSSDDASLQLLQISPGVLEPAFSPEVEAYTTSVGLSVDKLTVSARANNDKAVVAVEGNEALSEGENTITCQITAEDGTTIKVYTISVNKIEGGAGDDTGDDNNNESAPAELEVLSELRSSAKVIRIVALPDGVTVPQGFKESTISVGTTKVQGWTLESEADPTFCLFYAMNEEGEPDFYCYDIEEKTIQRYFIDTNNEKLLADNKQLAENYNSLVSDYQKARYIGFGLMGLAGVLIIVIIVLLVTKKNNNSISYESIERAPAEPAVRNSRGKNPTRKERYLMGEEDSEVLSSKIEDIADQGERDTSVTKEVEQVIAANLAKEAAAALEDEDDFEFFDLDDEK